MNNVDLNRILRNRAKETKRKFWWKRTGRCTPGKCGAACCRYTVSNQVEQSEYNRLLSYNLGTMVFGTKKIGKKQLVINNVVCPNMTMDCKCKLHGKKQQPYTCDIFPMHRDDGMYEVVKNYCGYKFVKVML